MDEPRLRNAARALVLDPADRVLLVLFRFKENDVWATPGGGIDPGETKVEALRRELLEEVGYRDIEIGPPIWTRTHYFPLGVDFDGQTETIFLVRVDAPPERSSLLTEEQLRQEFLVDQAWWTVPELRASDATFAPTRIAELVTDLITHGPPTTPIDVGL